MPLEKDLLMGSKTFFYIRNSTQTCGNFHLFEKLIKYQKHRWGARDLNLGHRMESEQESSFLRPIYFSHVDIFVYGQRPIDLVITVTVITWVILGLDTSLIYFWGNFLG